MLIDIYGLILNICNNKARMYNIETDVDELAADNYYL